MLQVARSTRAMRQHILFREIKPLTACSALKVRARAPASFLSGFLGTATLVFFLDSSCNTRQGLLNHPKGRARYAGIFVNAFFGYALVWAIITQHMYTERNPDRLDWSSLDLGRGFGLYIMTAGNLMQNYLACVIYPSHKFRRISIGPSALSETARENLHVGQDCYGMLNLGASVLHSV